MCVGGWGWGGEEGKGCGGGGGFRTLVLLDRSILGSRWDGVFFLEDRKCGLFEGTWRIKWLVEFELCNFSIKSPYFSLPSGRMEAFPRSIVWSHWIPSRVSYLCKREE